MANSAGTGKAPKRFTGTSRVGIEEAIHAAIHKTRSFKDGDTVRVVETRATLKHMSPWHITTYSVTIEKV
jgi:flavin-binding protein dodecin